MRRRFPIVSCFICGTAVVLAGCGSTGDSASNTQPGSTSSITPAPGAVAGELRRRLLTGSEFAGLTSGGVTVYTTAQRWVSCPPQEPAAQAAVEKAMLVREGFRGGAIENFTLAGTSGLSVVEGFRSAKAAREALVFYVSRLKAPGSTVGAYVSFEVSGIPGAMGFALGGANGGINVGFAQGDYYYLVGMGGGGSPAIDELNAAARHLYERVQG